MRSYSEKTALMKCWTCCTGDERWGCCAGDGRRTAAGAASRGLKALEGNGRLGRGRRAFKTRSDMMNGDENCE